MEPREIRNPYDAERVLPKPRLGEVFSYQRKSNATENCKKSLADQTKSNRKTCDRYGLPLDESCILSEKPGLGGDLWWDGVSMGTERPGEERRFRPAFSKLRDAILDDRCKAIVTYSQCRLFRNVSIANEFINLCVDHGVRIYDTAGLLDIWSSDGRAHIRHMASDNQRMREKARTETQRGIEDSLDEGEMVVVAGRLGFRSAGKGSKKVVAIPHELAYVKKIYLAFAHGIDERGPLCIKDIVVMLNEDAEFDWTPDIIEKRGKRTEHTKGLVYRLQVRQCLRDLAYHGYQKRKRIVKCDAFLVDGQPVIDDETWDLAKRKLESNKFFPPGRNREDRAFSGLIRCGVCGQTTAAVLNTEIRDRTDRTDPAKFAWVRYQYDGGGMSCKHFFHRIPVKGLDDYFDTVLAPLALTELEARESAASTAALLARRERLDREVASLQDRLDTEIPAMALELSPSTVSKAEKLLLNQLQKLSEELIAVSLALRSAVPLIKNLRKLDGLSASLRTDIVRQTIRWVAALPPTSPMVWDKQYKRWKKPTDGGRLLVLTTFGVYHTIKLTRVIKPGNPRHRYLSFNQAEEDEIIGTMNDLPDPALFVRGLRKTCASAYIDFDPTEWAPGIRPEFLLDQTFEPSQAA
jgi:hypothetical protein